MSSIPRVRRREYAAFSLPLLALLALLLVVIGLLGVSRGESFFGAIYGFPGTQLGLVLLMVAAGAVLVRLGVAMWRRLRFYQQLGPKPDRVEEDPAAWLSWLFVIALRLWPPFWRMRFGIWRRKRRSSRNIPDKPPLTVI